MYSICLNNNTQNTQNSNSNIETATQLIDKAVLWRVGSTIYELQFYQMDNEYLFWFWFYPQKPHL